MVVVDEGQVLCIVVQAIDSHCKGFESVEYTLEKGSLPVASWIE